jgi:membrane-bound inhibitor of C-type lysozyme
MTPIPGQRVALPSCSGFGHNVRPSMRASTAARLAGAVTALVLLGACRPAAPETAAPAPTSPPVAEAPVAPVAEVVESAPPALPVASAATPVETHWQCGDQRVAARFDPTSQTLSLIHERGQLTLPRIESASGARYADANGNEFWDKADAARLTLSGTPARDCAKVENGWSG